MDLDNVQALGPSDLRELEKGDYLLAVTREGVYVDEFESYVWREGAYDLTLRDGVLNSDGHSYLRMSQQEEGIQQGNEIEELYAVDGELAEEPFAANSLTDVLNQLKP